MFAVKYCTRLKFTDDSKTKKKSTRKSLNDIARWEEQDPSKCATYYGFGKKFNIY
jgi:hypothetical protein